MAKKRLSLDFELENYNDRKIWDYLETKKVKSKTIKSILNAYLDGAYLTEENLIEYRDDIKEEDRLNINELDPNGFSGF